MEDHTIEYWMKAKPGDTIHLSDVQTIEQCMIEDRSTDGIYYPIKTVHSIKEIRGLCTWLLFELADNEDNLTVLIKSVDGSVDTRVYYALPGIESGSRCDFISDGLDWIFACDCEAGQEDELSFTHDIINTVEIDSGEVEEVIYLQKRQGELFGKANVSGFDKELLATVVEYSTGHECDNPEMLIYERGDENSEGIISIMQGCNIHSTEIELV